MIVSGLDLPAAMSYSHSPTLTLASSPTGHRAGIQSWWRATLHDACRLSQHGLAHGDIRARTAARCRVV